jgi:hypothetical protein
MKLEYHANYERDVWGGLWASEPDVVEPLGPGDNLRQVLDDAAQALREGAAPGVPCVLRITDEAGHIIAEREVV